MLLGSQKLYFLNFFRDQRKTRSPVVKKTLENSSVNVKNKMDEEARDRVDIPDSGMDGP